MVTWLVSAVFFLFFFCGGLALLQGTYPEVTGLSSVSRVPSCELLFGICSVVLCVVHDEDPPPPPLPKN